MKRIVVATDGSPSACEAVEFGVDLAAEHGAQIDLVHVVPVFDNVPTNAFSPTAVLVHEVGEADRAPLEEAAEIVRSKGVEPTLTVLSGRPCDEIVAYADSVDADMIVVGSRGHGALASALIGSTSRGVLREARRPVLIVRGLAHHAEKVAAL
jgi:nucleotide-binding universal stress UspA family protein